MNITKEADYAIRVILHLSEAPVGEKISASTIAEAQNIPSQFLLKILRKLRQHELIESFMGVKGGYILKKSPEDISLRNVIEAIDGPIYLNRCLKDPTECNQFPHKCAVHRKLQGIQNRLLTDLDSVNFANIKG